MPEREHCFWKYHKPGGSGRIAQQNNGGTRISIPTVDELIDSVRKLAAERRSGTYKTDREEC